MAIVSDEPVRRDIPHEPGEWMEFRRLSASKLREARKAAEAEQREEAAELMRALGPGFVKSLRDEDEETRDRIVRQVEELQYHISNFDIPKLLKLSLLAWSYDDELPQGGSKGPFDMLDEETAVWAGKTAVEITRPPSKEEEEDFLPRSTGSFGETPSTSLASGS